MLSFVIGSSIAYFLLASNIGLLAFILALILVKPPPHMPRVKTIRPKGGNRHLAYQVRGDVKQPNCIIWLHGLASCRYEINALDEGAFQAAQAFVICFDRPGYGDSTLHAGRSYASGVEDILAIADAFNVNKFFLASVSGGGSYALAVASMAPSRVRGMLLLSTAGPYHIVSKEAQEDEMRRIAGGVRRQLRSKPWLMDVLLWYAETYVGGKLLWHLILGPEIRAIHRHLNRADVRIAKQPPASHFDVVLPESIRQATATPILQDGLMVRRPWPFDISKQVPEDLARATYIYHGAKDKVVLEEYAHVFKKMLPAASLEVIADGHHFDYWVGDVQRQREMLRKLIATGLPA